MGLISKCHFAKWFLTVCWWLNWQPNYSVQLSRIRNRFFFFSFKFLPFVDLNRIFWNFFSLFKCQTLASSSIKEKMQFFPESVGIVYKPQNKIIKIRDFWCAAFTMSAFSQTYLIITDVLRRFSNSSHENSNPRSSVCLGFSSFHSNFGMADWNSHGSQANSNENHQNKTLSHCGWEKTRTISYLHFQLISGINTRKQGDELSTQNPSNQKALKKRNRNSKKVQHRNKTTGKDKNKQLQKNWGLAFVCIVVIDEAYHWFSDAFQLALSQSDTFLTGNESV